ncbi:hypothetical protein C8J57DRAFT_1514466 [Mycena rebaudengoi]|nr:hypothetical protein C8J57DRAFT_1514466 [Mycena rebaudengoi]
MFSYPILPTCIHLLFFTVSFPLALTSLPVTPTFPTPPSAWCHVPSSSAQIPPRAPSPGIQTLASGGSPACQPLPAASRAMAWRAGFFGNPGIAEALHSSVCASSSYVPPSPSPLPRISSSR